MGGIRDIIQIYGCLADSFRDRATEYNLICVGMDENGPCMGRFGSEVLTRDFRCQGCNISVRNLIDKQMNYLSKMAEGKNMADTGR